MSQLIYFSLKIAWLCWQSSNKKINKCDQHYKHNCSSSRPVKYWCQTDFYALSSHIWHLYIISDVICNQHRCIWVNHKTKKTACSVLIQEYHNIISYEMSWIFHLTFHQISKDIMKTMHSRACSQKRFQKYQYYIS